jgi:type II restriction enzyme
LINAISGPAGGSIPSVTATFDDYDTAIRAFWMGRDLQTQKQIDSGKIDAGTRGSVTGGQHMAPLQDVIANQFSPLVELGAVVRRTGFISLPGFYRRAKNWDIVVTYQETLVAAIECKSQVGSFGNNFNNRTEEAIGSAVDLWRAYQEGYVGSVRPWLGFVLVIEHAPGSTGAIRGRVDSVYPTDPVFDDSSYTDRYAILFDRLVRERLYDAACLISSVRGHGIYDQPMPEVSTQNLTAAIAGRVAYIGGLA